MLIEDTEYGWQGWGDGRGSWDSRCRLRIYKHANNTVVIVSDLGLDSGTSITNSAENICTLICRDYAIAPEELLWFEHYPHLVMHKGESFDQVKFNLSTVERSLHASKFPGAYWIYSRPKWSPSSKEKVEELIGESLELVLSA